MSDSDDEEFLIIFQNNNLDEIMSESESKNNLTIGNLHEGVRDLSGIIAFITNFLVEFFEAHEDGEPEKAPKLTSSATALLLNIFETANCFIDTVDVEYDDKEENE